ncbi:MAG: amidase [Pseudomonadota bacterium]
MNLCDLDLVALGELLARDEASSREVVAAHIDRLDAVEPAINGMVQQRPDWSRGIAADRDQAPSSGPFWGLPYAVKDCLEVEGWVTTFGTMGHADHVSACSATVVNRLDAAGGVLLGLTNTPELGTSIETDNLIYGRTNNPIDLARSPGGSTGGGAALVKAGALPFVIGSDFGGGSRNTANCCGLVAHRPSLGRVSAAGYLFGCSGMKGQMCRIAPLARSVRDLELVFQVIGGADPDDPKTDGVTGRQGAPRADGARIALVSGSPVAPPEPEIVEAIEAFGAALGPKYHVEMPDLHALFAEGGDIAYSLFSADAGHLLRQAVEAATGLDAMSPSMAFWLESVGKLDERPAGDFIVLMSRWEAFRLTVNRLFETYDFLVCPASPTVAPHHGETFDEAYFWRAIAYTTPFSLTASPVLVVPVGIGRDGMPFCVQIVAPSWADEDLLAFGRSLQEGEGEARALIERALAVPVQVG